MTTCILRYVLFLGAADASHFLLNIYNHHKAEVIVTKLLDRDMTRKMKINKIV